MATSVGAAMLLACGVSSAESALSSEEACNSSPAVAAAVAVAGLEVPPVCTDAGGAKVVLSCTPWRVPSISFALSVCRATRCARAPVTTILLVAWPTQQQHSMCSHAEQHVCCQPHKMRVVVSGHDNTMCVDTTPLLPHLGSSIADRRQFTLLASHIVGCVVSADQHKVECPDAARCRQCEPFVFSASVRHGGCCCCYHRPTNGKQAMTPVRNTSNTGTSLTEACPRRRR